MAAKLEDVRQILAQSRADLMTRPNVVATGVGYKFTAGKQTNELAIICSVDSKQAKQNLTASELVPARIQDVPTDVYVSGVIYALQPPTGRFRPAPGGVSIGHVNISAGTLGCWVKKNGKVMLLSNNHVLANSNDANINDAILQPGPADGGTFPGNSFAQLAEFIPISFAGCGGSDCPIGNAAANVLNRDREEPYDSPPPTLYRPGT